MRRRPLIALAALLALALVAVPALSAVTRGGAAAARVTVRPVVGTPRTRFAVSFLTPRRLASGATISTRYAVSASGPGRRGCESSTSAAVAGSRPNVRLKLSLDPPRGGSWCVGTFSARILEIQAPVCGPAQACPQFIRVVGTIGKFSFRVKRPG